jgi:putative restriction endonuclease
MSRTFYLCPNHHTLLDYGGLTITPNLQVYDRLSGQRLGPLRTVTGHGIDVENLTYRLEHIQGNE